MKKEMSAVQRVVKQQEAVIRVLKKIRPHVPANVHVTANGNAITFYPGSNEDGKKMARLIVGNLMRALKTKPLVAKPWSTAKELTATFECGGCTIKVFEYQTAKCRIEKKTVVIPAEPAREAQPERTEEQEVLVCDL